MEHLLSQNGTTLLFLGQNGERSVELPAVAVRVLRGAIHHLVQGRAIAYFPLNEMLTTQEAAEILNVSRPHVVKLLERGEIPFERVTTHRRIKAEDLLAYKQRRDVERERHLGALAQMGAELGHYDDPVRPEDLEE